MQWGVGVGQALDSLSHLDVQSSEPKMLPGFTEELSTTTRLTLEEDEQ